MRLATWNVNSLAARMPRVVDWLATTRPDVVCLQETKLADAPSCASSCASWAMRPPSTAPGSGTGWPSCRRWGSTMCAAGSTASRGSRTRRRERSPRRAAVCVCGRCTSPTGGRWTARTSPTSWPGCPHCATLSRRAWRVAGRPRSAGTSTAPPATTTYGTPPRSSVRRTSARRSARLWRLIDLGFATSGSRAIKGAPFTYWDYRAGNFHKGMGMRIDLVLLGTGLAANLNDAYVDRDARKGKLPSDHAPVVVDVDLAASPAPPARSSVEPAVPP